MSIFGRRFGRERAGNRVGDSGGHSGDRAAHASVTMLTVRVAMAAAAIVGVTYVVIAVLVALVVSGNLMADVDRHLDQALRVATSSGQGPVGQGGDQQGPGGFDPERLNPRGVPVLLWKVSADGTIKSQGLNNVELPAADADVTGPTTVEIDGVRYRLAGTSSGGQRYVAGQALDGVGQTESTLIVAEIGTGCALLIIVFLGALAVGRRVALPIERTRVRQLEFTADASHELRTPLSVIEAQTSLAMARPRDGKWDGAAFARIDGELKRTRRLVDDMLWLARFDATSRQPESEPVDLAVLAGQTADRFGAVAEGRKQKLEVEVGAGEDAIVTAPPDWLDRLLAVLIDNACKYSPEGGSVRVAVAVVGDGRRVRLSVRDSGPGIPQDERRRVFDRFHRAARTPGGAGLGLAIADAIARATGGRWAIGESDSGGADVSITWPRSVARQ
jgi:two-component system, OmpR family, sensor histidine kinase CiaH